MSDNKGLPRGLPTNANNKPNGLPTGLPTTKKSSGLPTNLPRKNIHNQSDTSSAKAEPVNNDKNSSPTVRKSKFLTDDGAPMPMNRHTTDEEDSLRESEEIAALEAEDEAQESRKKKIIAGGILAAVLAVGGIGMSLHNPFTDGGKVGKATYHNGHTSADVPDDLASKLATPVPAKVNFWQSNGNTSYPVNLQDWQTNPYSTSDSASLIHMRNFYAKTQLGVSSHRLPSAAAGFTSDPTKMKLSNGSMNPVYTAITSEDYQNQVESDVERLINPLFGSWQRWQYATGKASSTFAVDKFADIFTQNWLQSNSGKNPKEYFPVWADWNDNDYGMSSTLLDNGPRWVGTVKKMTSKFTFDQNTQQYSSDVTVNILYSAWTKDQNTVTRNGVLTLHTITQASPGTKAKVLIDSASLKVDDQ